VNETPHSPSRNPGPPERRNPLERFGLALATGLGAGRAPVAPGTAGTLVAIPVAVLVGSAGSLLVQAVLLVALVALLTWACEVGARCSETEDPGWIVADEVAGYLVAMAFLPVGWLSLAAAFVLFRLFDITKPPPCRRAEHLPGGFGVMADDLLAGLYANGTIRILAGLEIFSL
jgi:phosphatidylglycerophosphatase A